MSIDVKIIIVLLAISVVVTVVEVKRVGKVFFDIHAEIDGWDWFMRVVAFWTFVLALYWSIVVAIGCWAFGC